MITLVPEIRCDVCARTLTGHHGDTFDQLRDAAIADGWQTGGGLHTCTTCSAPIDLVPTGATDKPHGGNP